jgi:hypothetical protein
MQHTLESKQGDENYRLRVAYNNGNLVTRNIIDGYNPDTEAVTYVEIDYVQMFSRSI